MSNQVKDNEQREISRRVIKFRAWDKLSNGGIMLPAEQFGQWNIPFAVLASDTQYVLQQFTGLLDKNGKEIYEGDILKSNSGTEGEVTFSNGTFIWKGDSLGWDMEGETQEICLPERWGQVIGHIYSSEPIVK